MHDDHQAAVDQVLEAIEYGLLPVDEIEKRLRQIVDEELSGSMEAEYDRQKVDLCNSLLQQINMDGQCVLDERFAQMKAGIEERHAAYKRRKRILTRTAGTMAVLLVVFAGLIAFNVISPIRWFTGQSTVDEQQYVTKGHEINLDTVARAIAEHNESGEIALSTTDYSDLISFIGFDPYFPSEISHYTNSQYDAIIMPNHIMIACDYYDNDSTASSILLSKSIYMDIDMAYEQYEQDKSGEMIYEENMTIYKYTNAGRTSYLWVIDSTISLLSFDEGITIEPSVIHDIIKYQTEK